MKILNAVIGLAMIGSLSAVNATAAGFSNGSEVKTVTVSYTLDQKALDSCFDSLIVDANKTGVMRCAVELNGPYLAEKFQKYLKTGHTEAQTGWNCDSLGQENPGEGSAETDASCLKKGFSVNASLEVNLQSLKITMVIGDPFGGELVDSHRILKRQIMALKEQLNKSVNSEFEIVYTEKK